jgi:hypothetical protein
MVEEAVEEVLELMKKAAQEFKAGAGVDEFDFCMEGKTFSYYGFCSDTMYSGRWI